MPRASALVAAALAALALGAGARAQPPRDRVQVEADRLTIDRARHSARFVGNVVARYGDLTLTCAEMTAAYDDAGAIAALEAKGGVVVRRGDATAEAARARLDTAAMLLVLEGAPTVRRGPHTLSGRRIAVHLASGEIEVLEARGTFALPLGKPE